MSQLQDRVRDDLRRFMSDEPPDNIDEIRAAVKERLVTTDSIKIVPLTYKGRQGNLYSDRFNKKLSKVRPQYLVRIMGLVFCGLVFGTIAALSMIIVNYPYNLVLAPIALAPFVVAVIRVMRHGYKINNKRELL